MILIVLVQVCDLSKVLEKMDLLLVNGKDTE